ncbi:MAG: PP2C family protein-serine/threonine phosphatase [Nocardioidaceae bacterium]
MSETNKRALTYRYVAVTDVGRRRTMNQDSGYASSRLLAIADGMGGAAAGDLASAETMHVVRRLDAPLEGDVLEALAGAVHRANDRLAEVIEDDSAVEGMGTTLTVMLWDGQRFGLAHIGDSRGYRLRAGALTQITTDHTFVQSLVDQGQISREDAHAHPHRNLILRVLVGSDDDEPDLTTIEPEAGDRYLLCSDGLSDMVDDAGIAEALGAENIDVAAVELVRRALDAGGSDNVTCVIAEVVDADTPDDENLAAASGEPMLVGAASDQARPRSARHASNPADETGPGQALRADTDEQPSVDDDDDVDPEELRYAPRPPRRSRWITRVVIAVLVLAAVAVAGRIAYGWTQDQYFVSESAGRVAIYRGVQENVPLFELDSVYEVTEIDLKALPTFAQNQVRDGIEAQDLQDARGDVQSLRDIAAKCADPKQAGKPGSECQGAS